MCRGIYLLTLSKGLSSKINGVKYLFSRKIKNMKKSFIFNCLVCFLLSGCFKADLSDRLMNQPSCKLDGSDELKIVNGSGVIDGNFVILEFSKIDSTNVAMKIVPSNVTLVVPVTEELGYLFVNLEGQKDFVKCKIKN